MKVRTRLALALLLITVILSGATYGGLELYKQQQIGETQESVNETARLTAQQIDRTIQQRRDYVGFIASRPRASEFSKSSVFLDQFIANSRFYAAQIIAANGTAIDFRGGVTEQARQEVIGSDLSDRPYVSNVLETGEIYMTDVEYADSTDSYLTIISAPIFEDQKIVGVLAAAIYINTETFFTMVPPLERKTQVVRITAGEETTLHASGRSFNQKITGASAVESVGWQVQVVRDASGLTTELRNLAIAQGGGLIGVLGLVIGLGYWQYTTSLQQAERLLDGFAAVREGNYDYSLELGAGEEWVQISDGFNNLSQGLKTREQQLRERQQRLEVLYRVLRHNVRNEMSVIQNYADIISDFTDDDTIEDAADTILDAGSDLVNLSEKARQIENAMEAADTELSAVEVVDVVERVVEEMRDEYEGVTIETSAPETARAAAIPAFETAVENVCENACKHNDADEPRVDVSVETTGETVELAIADNGPGIPEQERNVLSKGEETSLEHGSGLGLWLVYWIVDKSGGTIEFHDNEPRGSIVDIELDRGAPDAGEAAGAEAEAEAAGAVEAAEADGGAVEGDGDA